MSKKDEFDVEYIDEDDFMNLGKNAKKLKVFDIERNGSRTKRKIKLHELDLNDIEPREIGQTDKGNGAKYLEIGHPGSGKSSLLTSILWAKKHIIPVAQVYSGSESSNNYYSSLFPPVFIYNSLKIDNIQKLIERQIHAKKYLENPWALLVIDDCFDDKKIFNHKVFGHLSKEGRHHKLLQIMAMQYVNDVGPVIRSCADGIFIFRESNLKNRKNLFDYYAGAYLESFSDFCAIMDEVCQNFNCLFVKNNVQSNKLEDCLFYYKADMSKIPEDFKFGCKSLWDFNEQRYDPEYQNQIIKTMI